MAVGKLFKDPTDFYEHWNDLADKFEAKSQLLMLTSNFRLTLTRRTNNMTNLKNAIEALRKIKVMQICMNWQMLGNRLGILDSK